ncbi:MAG: hypothetical protein FJY65_07770 [Calditrichaeota bacterium]|nr:hypothetical protein [Calditrichota bacterium]
MSGSYLSSVGYKRRIPGGYRPKIPFGTYLAQGDNVLIWTAVVMPLFGLVMVYSASIFIAIDLYSLDWYYLYRQTFLVLLSFGALFLGMRLPVEQYQRYAKLLILAFLLLMLWQVFFGPVIRHTRRFIRIFSWTIQTSEFARCIVIMYLARVFSARPQLIEKFDLKFIAVLLPVAVMVILIYAQKDFSAAAMMAALAGALLLLAGLSWKLFSAVSLAALSSAAFFVWRSDYQLERIIAFLQRIFLQADLTATSNYHGLQSILCFGCGGIFGVGLGSGIRKMLFLPEPHTDFIYATIGEELGLWGTVAVLVAFTMLMFRAVRVLKMQTDRFGFLLGSGLLISLLMFAFVHMGVTTELLPVTGLPLPFISSGGSSLIVSMWSIGVLWNLSRRANGYV